MAVESRPEREGAAGPGGAGGCRRGPEGAGPEGAGEGRRVPGPESAGEDRRGPEDAECQMPGAERSREPEGAGSRKVPKEPEGAKGARKNPKTGPGRNRRNPRSPEGAREARKEPNENEGPVARRVPRLFCLLVLPVVRRSLAGLWLTVGRSLAGCSADYICRLLPVLTGFQAVPPVVGWSLTRSFAGRLSVACRDFPGCQLLRRLFAGSSPVLSVGAAVPRALLRLLPELSVNSAPPGSLGFVRAY